MLRRIAIVLALAAALAPAARAEVRHAAGTRDAKPELPAGPTALAVFDCSGRDTLALAPGMELSIQDDTTGGPRDLDAYSCRGWPEDGPEHVYRLEVAQDLELTATVAAVEQDVDLDLFLLDGCDTEACVLGENVQFAATLTPGSYWLVVDGYGTSATPDSLKSGAYDLTLTCRPIGLPAEICDGTASEPLACDVGTVFTRNGTLFGREDLVRAWDCNPYLARAGEAWIALDLLPGQALTATTTVVADSLDAVLWLFDGCGPDAVCLASSDNGLAGATESLSWQSATADTVTVYLAVDGARPPVTETAGTWELGITCGTEVPVHRTSFGGARALFR